MKTGGSPDPGPVPQDAHLRRDKQGRHDGIHVADLRCAVHRPRAVVLVSKLCSERLEALELRPDRRRCPPDARVRLREDLEF